MVHTFPRKKKFVFCDDNQTELLRLPVRKLASLTDRFLYAILEITTGPVDKWSTAREERWQGNRSTCFRASGKESIYTRHLFNIIY